MDAFIFTGGVIATIVLWQMVDHFALFVPFLLTHFFLFCNTFRIGGERSLIWVGTFLLNMYFWISSQNLELHIGIQTIVTACLIAHCMFGKNYHGFACERINPYRYRDGAMTEGAFTRHVLLCCRVPKPLIEMLVGRQLHEFESNESDQQPIDNSTSTSC